MKLFSYKTKALVILCWAFNRGHAVKQIAKTVEGKGLAFSKETPIEEIPEANEKGAVYVMHEGERSLVPLDGEE